MKRLLTEIIAWIAANVVCSVAAVSAVFGICTVLGFSQVRAGSFILLMAIVSLTWGSWAALTWTRSKPLRVWMRISTALPGLITLGVGGLGAYVNIGALPAWIAIMLAGVGMMVVALILARQIGSGAIAQSRSGIAVSAFTFPIVSVALALGVGALWYQFVTGLGSADWRALFGVASILVTTLAMALASTIVPAVANLVSRSVAANLR